MSDLKLDILRPEALSLFKKLSLSPELEGITLLGGTALALQIGHRYSLDFDFAVFTKKLPIRKIDNLIARLKNEGDSAQLVTDSGMISQFKINTGDSLLDYARDYVINGVKVTFFAHGRTDEQRQYYTGSEKLVSENRSFNLLGLGGLKVAKTLVLADRVRSRDLFDLMVLIEKYEYSLNDAFKVISELGHNDDIEYYKSVVSGVIGLDKSDEGLSSVDVSVPISDIYTFFESLIEEYEVDIASQYFLKPNS
jgi:hypothetical protein